MSGMIPNYPGITVTAPGSSGGSSEAPAQTANDVIGAMSAQDFFAQVKDTVKAAVSEAMKECEMEEDDEVTEQDDANNPLASLVPYGESLFVQQRGSTN